MDKLTDISAVKALLEAHGFRFSKALGQNFLINPSVCPRMAASCGADDQSGILEIGPGIGTLTRELCRTAKNVVSIELDDRLPALLAKTMADFDNFTLVQGDALKLDLNALIDEHFGDMPVYVCANLPYYITSPLIMHLLESRLPIDAITVMVQKEAAERLCAKQGSREAGAVTLAVQYYAQAESLFDVSRGSFIPAPNVDSRVIRLTLHKTPPCDVQNEKRMFSLIRAAFNQRRKTLTNSLMGAGFSKVQIADACETCGIAPTARAEQLTLQDYAALSNVLGG